MEGSSQLLSRECGNVMASLLLPSNLLALLVGLPATDTVRAYTGPRPSGWRKKTNGGQLIFRSPSGREYGMLTLCAIQACPADAGVGQGELGEVPITLASQGFAVDLAD